jgi:peptidoglycan hydrolase CwlO-like protein
MKKRLLMISIIVGFTSASNAETHVYISGVEQSPTSSDDKGNVEYIYVDKNSHIVNSVIGTNISTDGDPMTKEEQIEYYKKRIQHYEDKITHYEDKIKRYEEKITYKPKYRERYEHKIESYREKIENSKNKIESYKNKIIEAQK